MSFTSFPGTHMSLPCREVSVSRLQVRSPVGLLLLCVLSLGFSLENLSLECLVPFGSNVGQCKELWRFHDAVPPPLRVAGGRGWSHGGSRGWLSPPLSARLSSSAVPQPWLLSHVLAEDSTLLLRGFPHGFPAPAAGSPRTG